MLEIITDNETLIIIIKLILVIIGSCFIYQIFKMALKKILHINLWKVDIDNKKEITIHKLLCRIAKLVIFVIDLIIILEILNINTTAIIATLSASLIVVGLAFQDIIKDFISGAMFIIDNVFNIGDIIEIGGYKGKLVDFGLRSIRIKNKEGNIKIIPNHKVTEVINYSLVEESGKNG